MRFNRLTRCCPVIAALLFTSAVFMGQDPPQNTFSKAEDGVLFKLHPGFLEVRICSESLVHILYSLQAPIPPPTVPIVITDRSNRVPFQVVEINGIARISTSKLTVAVELANGRITFLDHNDAIILQEPKGHGKTLAPAVVDGESTWRPEQRFLSPPDEAFYGLGQHQEGFFNWRGIPLRLQQVDANIAMPFVLSSKGYGLLWNSAALTDFNPTDEIVQIDPVTKTGKFRSGESGVYGFLATGGTGREHLGLRVGGEAVIGFDGYLVPYAGSGILNLQPNTDYTLKMEGAGEHAKVYVRPPTNTTGFRSDVGDAIDYYFFYGPDLNEVIKQYRDATGIAPMFPRWAYGFWQCRERYSSEDQLLEAAAGFRQRHIPVDVMVQDWQYWGKFGWNAMKFDLDHYPNPARMIRTLHSENLHFAISVWSKFDAQTETYKQMKARSFLVPGSDWFDAFNPQARALFWSSMRDGLFKFGVDGWWLDATEPEGDILKNNQTFMGSGNVLRNAYPLYVTLAVYQGQRATAPDKRVVILTRSAFPGQQRNATSVWSGDVAGDWETFRRQVSAGLNFTMTGIPYWTTDVGGFNRPSDQYKSLAYHELLTRWFEYGIFCPLFRIHGDQSETEIWNYGPDVEKTFREYDEFRYRILPYIYSSAWMVTRQGYNLMRSLPLDYRTDPNVANVGDEYMFGPSLLINPVTAAGATSRMVYLPKESGWIDFWTGETAVGGQTIRADAPLNKIPVYVKAGAIVPMGPVMQYTTEKRGPIELRVYTGRDANFVLYDDRGDGYDYEAGGYATISVDWKESSRTLIVGARHGTFLGMPRTIVFHIVLVGNGRGIGFGASEADATISYSGHEARVRFNPIQ